MHRYSLLVLIMLVFIAVRPAHAQQSSQWGVSGSVTPRWQSEDRFLGPLFEVDHVDLHGNQFEIGIVRGATWRGDWGVSFVRKNIAASSRFADEYFPSCLTRNDIQQCGGENGQRYSFQGAYLHGLHAHKFIPFATIHRRVQIGLTVGGGAGWYRGSVVRELSVTQIVLKELSELDRFETTRTQTSEDIASFVREEGAISVLPLGTAEVTAAAIVAPGFKVKVSGGFSYPGYNRFSVQAMYLFGRNDQIVSGGLHEDPQKSNRRRIGAGAHRPDAP